MLIILIFVNICFFFYNLIKGPYAWVPPIYWSSPENQQNELGGPFGFLTEGGPGAAPMRFQSWAKTVPSAHLWPSNGKVVGDPYWDGHCGNPQGIFGTLKYFDPPLNARYGTSSSAEEYLFKSQVAAYESHRVMFEEYARAQVESSTGLIHWMLNSAYPSHIWHLYDYYLAAGGSFFGAKKALTDLVHAQFRYSDRSVWLYTNLGANNPQIPSQISLNITVFNPDLTVLFQATHLVSFSGNATIVTTLPTSFASSAPTFFIRLAWTWPSLSQPLINDYWLSSVSQDVLLWDASTFYRTPCSSYSDFTALQLLMNKPLSLEYSLKLTSSHSLQVYIFNPTSTFAFAIEATLVDGSLNEILPQLWSDNYFSLLPGQGVLLSVQTISPLPSSGDYTIVLQSWNSISTKHHP